MNKNIQKTKESNAIVIYKKGKDIQLEVHLENETVWLTQAQIASLFSSERSVITKHIRNIFTSGELEEKSTVQKMHIPNSDKPVSIYNLDVIISVGYRVNSKNATQFRMWATKTLKDFLVKGYVIHEKRLLETREKFRELQNTVAFLHDQSKKELLSGQGSEILNLLSSYAKTLTILDGYDKGVLQEVKGTKGKYVLEYTACKEIIAEIKKELIGKGEAGDLFGNERDESFSGIIKGLYQTFGGKELYTTLESKAAHLLYFIIKDHPFSDGNKRTSAFLFVYFLDKNDALYRELGEKKINDNALAALALLVAESDPKEKEQMVALITQLLK